MQKLKLICGLVVLLLLAAGPASAQIQLPKDPDLERRFKTFLESMLLEVRCPVPDIEPLVTNLRRGSSPNPSQIVKVFLGDKENLLGTESVISPIWGKGARTKSGTIIRVLVDKEIKQSDSGTTSQAVGHLDLEKMGQVEVVPAFLDTYRQGFLYTNNIPHKAVYATDVKVVSELKANVSYHNLYEKDEGRKAAMEVLSDTVGQPTVGKGFQLATEDQIQKYGERLYAVRMTPEYLTSYAVYDWDAKAQKLKQTGTKPVAVKVNDVYIHILLDGDKLLCGMEYFWDNGLKPEGAPQASINAAEAIMKSREWMVKRFNNNPPQIIISRITLGFVQDKQDPTLLVPAWIMGAYYTAEDDNGSAGMGANVVQVPCPFAVNALSGAVFDL